MNHRHSPTSTARRPHRVRADRRLAAMGAMCVTIGSCWIQDEGCKIDGASVMCIVGDSPSDLVHDCKEIDSSYTDNANGYSMANIGPRFLGAGALAAATASANPLVPFSACTAM